MDIDHTYLSRIYKQQENALYVLTRCCRCGIKRPVITVDDSKGWTIVQWNGKSSVPEHWDDGSLRVFTQKWILNFERPIELECSSISWLCPTCNMPGVIIETGHEIKE